MARVEVTVRVADGAGQAADDPGREMRRHFALEPDQQIVFGRSPDVDVIIPDHNRKVSSRHARIVCQPDDTLRAYDLASLNGTYLHGTELDAEIGAPLVDGDRLRVGDFEVAIAIEPDPVPDPAPAAWQSPTDDQPVAAAGRPAARRRTPRETAAGAPAAPLVREAVERAYAESLQQVTSEREGRMAAALERGLAALPEPHRESVAAALLDEFWWVSDYAPGEQLEEAPDRVPQEHLPLEHLPQEHLPQGAPQPVTPMTAPDAPVAAAGGSPAAGTVPARGTASQMPDDGIEEHPSRTQADHLQMLALRLVPGTRLQDDEQRGRFMTLLAQVCEATLEWLARGLEGRAVFGQEFGAEVTVVFQRSTNPLKGMSREDLQRYLLDWTNSVAPDSRRHYLDGVLEDLHEHQVGVLAGVEEAITGVLNRLSPERVDGLAAQQKSKGWTAAARSWQTYCQLHKELVEERSKLFHELITPAIQKGYLHRHGDRNDDAPMP